MDRDTHGPAHQIIDAKQDDTVRQSEPKTAKFGDLSWSLDRQTPRNRQIKILIINN